MTTFSNPTASHDITLLLEKLSSDLLRSRVKATASPSLSPMLEIGPWRGLRNVFIGQNEIIFDTPTIYFRLDCSILPTTLADRVKMIWLMVNPLTIQSSTVRKLVCEGPEPE